MADRSVADGSVPGESVADGSVADRSVADGWVVGLLVLLSHSGTTLETRKISPFAFRALCFMA